MSSDYFKEFASWLMHTRESVGLSTGDVRARTKLSDDVLRRIESGDLKFVSTVFMAGYLKLYASAIGMDPEAVVSEYRALLKKIEFLESDHAVLAVDDGSPKPEQPEVIGFDPETAHLAKSTLDQAVRTKILSERNVNIGIFSLAGLLGVMSLYFLIADTGSSNVVSVSPLARYERKAEEYKPKKLEPRKRLAFFLSEPILTEEDRLRLEEQALRQSEDSLRSVQYRINRRLKKNEPMPVISVQDAAREIESELKKYK